MNTGTGYVPPCGPLSARIAIVGEAPGQQEVAYSKPFVGPSGKLLDQMLAKVGIDREQCYLTNILKIRPPNNDFGVFYNDAKRNQPSTQLTEATQALIEELKRVRPNITIALGAEPLRALTGRRGIDTWRGSILPSPCGKVIGTYHPSFILRTYGSERRGEFGTLDRAIKASKVIAELDLKRAKEESTRPDIEPLNTRFIIDPSFEQVLSTLKKIGPIHKRIAFDIETSGPLTRCLGLAWSGTEAICVPFISGRRELKPGDTRLFEVLEGQAQCSSYWSEEQEYEILVELNRIFQDPTIGKYAQNFPFDSTVLGREFGLDIQGLWQDTMLAHHVCYCELPKGLDFLASIYTRIPYYSDYDPASDQQTWIYNCWDCVATFQCATRLSTELEDMGLVQFYHSHQQPAMLAYNRINGRGVKIDITKRESLAQKVEGELNALNTAICTIVGRPDFNPDSPKQLSDYLYGTLGLPTQRHHKTHEPTVDKNALANLASKYPQHKTFFEMLLEQSRKSTLLHGFLRQPLGTDGRIRTQLNAAGTVTGRLSSAKPLFDPGTNLQNVPIRTFPDLRTCFIADPGWVIMKADLSQAEFRLVVWFAKIERLIKRYKDDPNFDCHKWLASLIYRCTEDKVTKEQRGVAKNGIYGGNYDMHAPTASRVYGIPLTEAKWVLSEHRKAIPEIPLWWLDVQAKINTTRVLTNPYGRKRIFFGRADDDMYRSAYSHLPQSTVADHINQAVSHLEQESDEREFQILLQVHDEIVAQIRADVVDKWVSRVRYWLELPIRFAEVGEPLVIPADIGVGPSWGETKKVKVA